MSCVVTPARGGGGASTSSDGRLTVSGANIIVPVSVREPTKTRSSSSLPPPPRRFVASFADRRFPARLSPPQTR